MKVVLKEEELSRIISRNVSKILTEWNLSRRSKRTRTYQNIGAAVSKYRDSLISDFVPILIEDFGGTTSVKMTGMKMETIEVEKIKTFARRIAKSSVNCYKDDLEREVGKILEEHVGSKNDELGKIIDRNHHNMTRYIDCYINKEILKMAKSETMERSKLEAKIFNFTEIVIDEDIEVKFKLGMDAVPSLGLTIFDVKKRVNDALLEYLERYRAKYSWSHINQVDVMKWIEDAIKVEGVKENLEFYQRVADGYSGLMEEFSLNYKKEDIDTEMQLKRRLEIQGCVIVQCDKNLGMSMFTLKTMREADEKLMQQLGAVPIEKNKDEVLQQVFAEISEFEEGLDNDQKEYLDFTYRDRRVSDCEIVIPFLRSTHKIQKMSEEEIDKKDISNLKFRPVIDTKRWATRGFAELAMKMMRKACQEMLERCGPVLGKLKVKNGWDFSVDIQDYEFEDKHSINFSADFQEAYTNVTAKMINESIEVVCKYLGWKEWKISLMKKIIILVLGNNFVETSTGIYLFKMVLPMGYKLSGESLDIVGIAGEMSKMLNLGKEGSTNLGTPVGEIQDYPEEIVDVDASRECTMAKNIKKFKRYVDDTFGIISGDKIEEIIDGILAIGFMYPVGLVINMELNIWRAEFLDVFCWKELSGNTMSTMMKRNFKVPFGHVKNGSDHPDRYKLKSLLGEMLRNRRTSSDEEIVEVIDQCIKEDFVSIGYTRREVDEEMSKSKERIKTNYKKQFVKMVESNEKSYGYYGGSVVYNGHYEYNKVLENFIRLTKPAKPLKLCLKPGRKLKTLAYTKKSYLKRQKIDVGASK